MAEAMRDHLALLARYHAWATARLLAAVAPLAEPVYRGPSGLFFGSIHGTLNHLLVTDAEIWSPRFMQGRSPALALDAEIEADRVRLATRLTETAELWSSFVAALDAPTLAGELVYRTTTGEERRLPYAATLLHVFNHGTHHRAQITAAISAAGREFPPLDLLVLIAAENAAPASATSAR